MVSSGGAQVFLQREMFAEGVFLIKMANLISTISPLPAPNIFANDAVRGSLNATVLHHSGVAKDIILKKINVVKPTQIKMESPTTNHSQNMCAKSAKNTLFVENQKEMTDTGGDVVATLMVAEKHTKMIMEFLKWTRSPVSHRPAGGEKRLRQERSVFPKKLWELFRLPIQHRSYGYGKIFFDYWFMGKGHRP